jgi:hypothetical protein
VDTVVKAAEAKARARHRCAGVGHADHVVAESDKIITAFAVEVDVQTFKFRR